MQILVVAKKPPYPAHDGEAIAIRQMVLGLRNAGNSVFLIYLNTEKHHTPSQEVANDLQIPVHAVEINTMPTPTGAAANILSGLPYHVERFAHPYLASAIRLYLNDVPDALVQAEGLFMIQPIIDAVRQGSAQAPVPTIIYRSHNIEGEIWQDLSKGKQFGLRRWYYKLQGKRLRAFEELVLSKIDAVVPISRDDADWYAQKAPALKQQYIPAGIQFTEPIVTPVQPGTLYYIGGLDWLPNREGLSWFFAQCWPTIKAAVPDAVMHIAGRNAPADFASTLPPEVVFHGEVDDAAHFAADKQICIVPLLSGSGMKIKIAEAMAAGKAIVTSPKAMAGMPEGMSDHCVIKESPADFAQAVITLLNNPQDAQQKGIAAQTFVRAQLDNNQLGVRLTQFYQSLRQA